jgi:hypothetical protein
MIGARVDLEALFQVLSRVGQVAGVNQCDAVVVVLFGRTERHSGLLEAAVAHGDVEVGALGDVAFRAGGGLLKEVARFLQLSGVEQPHGRLEGRHLLRSVVGGRAN